MPWVGSRGSLLSGNPKRNVFCPSGASRKVPSPLTTVLGLHHHDVLQNGPTHLVREIFGGGFQFRHLFVAMAGQVVVPVLLR